MEKYDCCFNMSFPNVSVRSALFQLFKMPSRLGLRTLKARLLSYRESIQKAEREGESINFDYDRDSDNDSS